MINEIQKEAAYLTPIVQAAAEGKKILWRRRDGIGGWLPKVEPGWQDFNEYKVEEPPKLIPYGADKWHEITRVKDKRMGNSYAVGMVNIADGKVIIGGYSFSFRMAMEEYTHINGDALGTYE